MGKAEIREFEVHRVVKLFSPYKTVLRLEVSVDDGRVVVWR
jgi:hypothetical protein